MIYLSVRDRDAAAQATEPITSGSVGMRVGFSFSESWDGLAKIAVFRGAGQSVDVALTGSSCELPHEVLQSAGGHLKIGVYGIGDEGQKVTPTVWADAGSIVEGAEPSEIEPTPATESLVQQILEAAEEARDIAQSVRDDADAGEFDGQNGEDGVSPSLSSSAITGGHRVSMTDKDGTTTFDVMDGQDGQDGEDGQDGVSPIISSESITGGHRLTIVDAGGTTTVDVMDGEDGDPGADGADGADGNCIWWTNYEITSSGVPGYGVIAANRLKGRTGTPAAHDLVVGPAIGQPGSIEYLYEITSVAGSNCALKSIGSIKGDPGTGAVTSVNGQTGDVVLSIVVTCTFTSADGGTCDKNTSEIKAAMDAGAVVYFSGAMPGIGSVKYLATGYTDTGSYVAVAAQAVGEPNGAFYDFYMPFQDAGYNFLLAERKFLDTDLGSINAGKFLVVGSDGIVVPTAITAWQGGSY